MSARPHVHTACFALAEALPATFESGTCWAKHQSHVGCSSCNEASDDTCGVATTHIAAIAQRMSLWRNPIPNYRPASIAMCVIKYSFWRVICVWIFYIMYMFPTFWSLTTPKMCIFIFDVTPVCVRILGITRYGRAVLARLGADSARAQQGARGRPITSGRHCRQPATSGQQRQWRSERAAPHEQRRRAVQREKRSASREHP